MLRKAVFILVFASLLAVARPVQAKSYYAERFDVNIAVQADGALLVTETVVFRFSGGPFTYVYRNINFTELDAIDQVTAGMDGITLPTGSAAGQVEMEGSSPLKITWHFAPTSDATHTYTLTYRVLGAMRKLDTDRLVWRAIPEEHEYTISSSLITLTYPASTTLVSAPQANGAQAEVDNAGRRASVTLGNISSNRQVDLTANFQPGSLAKTAPQWQVYQEARQKQTAAAVPVGIVCGVLVLLAGAFLLSWFWNANRRQAAAQFTYPGSARTTPPGPLAPALAAWLTGNRAPALATLFDLARRGVISVEESKGFLGTKSYTLNRLENGELLLAHEQGLLEALFSSRGGLLSRVPMGDAGSKLGSHPSQFAKPLEEEIAAAGWLDGARQIQRKWLVRSGVAALAFGLASLLIGVVMIPISSQTASFELLLLGAAGLGAGAAMELLALVALIASASFSIFSEEGERQAAAWKDFAAYLKKASRQRTLELPASLFEPYLAYAAGFGIASQWTKLFQKHGGAPIPTWFHALQGSAAWNSFDGFAAMISSSKSSGSSGGDGGGGGGASGGGGSGAG